MRRAGASVRGSSRRREPATRKDGAQTPITTQRLNDVPSASRSWRRDADCGDSGEIRDADHAREPAGGAPAAEQPQEPGAGGEEEQVADKEARRVGDHDRGDLAEICGGQAADGALQQPRLRDRRADLARVDSQRHDPACVCRVGDCDAGQEVAERPLPERLLRASGRSSATGPGSTCRPAGCVAARCRRSRDGHRRPRRRSGARARRRGGSCSGCPRRRASAMNGAAPTVVRGEHEHDATRRSTKPPTAATTGRRTSRA